MPATACARPRISRGYTIGARLLRPSLVVVAQAPPAEDEAGAETEAANGNGETDPLPMPPADEEEADTEPEPEPGQEA